jgi:hypothetical protein
LPDYLEATAKYNFRDKSIALCFWDLAFDWSLVSLTGLYNFSNTKIEEGEFVDITGNDFVYNIAPTGRSVKAKVFKLNIARIDRHILMRKFSINLSYIFLDDLKMQLYTTKFAFEVRSIFYVSCCQTMFLPLKGSIFPNGNALAVQIPRTLPC